MSKIIAGSSLITTLACAITVVGILSVLLLTQKANLSLQLWLGIVLLQSLLLHCGFNFLHQASHRQISRTRWLNDTLGHFFAILGGMTYPGFRTTHLAHHAYVGNKTKDPDFLITRGGSIWLIPFRIWYHDRWFWQTGAWKRPGATRGYWLDRSIQLILVGFFLSWGMIWTVLFLWLLPLLIMGYCNALFLFYFPHYQPAWETKLRHIQAGSGLHHRMVLKAIDISRVFHELHHHQVTDQRAYYPIIGYIRFRLLGTWNRQMANSGQTYLEQIT